MKTGVYFSANDAVFEWTRTFLNSFRVHNPDLKLYLIPFDDNCDRTRQLSDCYAFDVYEAPEFSQLEEIGQRMELGHTSYGPFWFRRYASFFGPLDYFIYLDARQVVLANLQLFVDAVSGEDFDLVYTDAALDQVYEPGPMRTSFLSAGGAAGFMSNSWASRSGLFCMDDFKDLAAQVIAQRDQMNPRNTDQAFINYCCDARGLRTALLSDVLGDMCRSGWARQRGHVYRDKEGVARVWDYGGLDHKKRVLLVHWAGMPFSFLGPKGRLLRQYGKHSLLFIARNFIYDLTRAAFEAIRRCRWINQLYWRWREW